MNRSHLARTKQTPARLVDPPPVATAAALLRLARPPAAVARQAARRAARGVPVAPPRVAHRRSAPIRTLAGLKAHFKRLRDLIAAWPAQVIALIAVADAVPPSIIINRVAWFKTEVRFTHRGALHVTKDGKRVALIRNRTFVFEYKIHKQTCRGQSRNLVRTNNTSYMVSRLVMSAFHGAPGNRVVDHINHDSLCDHVHNLRYVSTAHNLINSTQL